MWCRFVQTILYRGQGLTGLTGLTIHRLGHTSTPKTYYIGHNENLHELDKDVRSGDIQSFKLVQSRSPCERVDEAFDSAVRMVIHSARRRPDIRLLIATDNTESIRKAIFEANMTLKNSDSEPSSKQVQFALAPDISDIVHKIILKHGYVIQP